MFKKTSGSLLSLAMVLLCAACSNGGSSSTASTASPTTSDKPLTLGSGLSENPNAFTVVVGTPFVKPDGSTPMYDALYANLTTPAQQAKVPIARILLAVENPGVTGALMNSVFRIGDSFTLADKNNGKAITFLNNLALYNAKASTPIEIYAYPDVEEDSLWESWVPPTNAPTNIPSCKASLNQPTPAQTAMLKSICWVTLVNQLINPDKLTITGVAYDNQSNYLAKTNNSAPGWTYPYAHGDAINKSPGLNLGWISAGGMAIGTGNQVDLNLIEVYDVYAEKSPYFDSVATASVASKLPLKSTPLCTGVSCAYQIGTGICKDDKTKKDVPCPVPFFPGYQYLDPSNTYGAVGSNIYQCAISTTPAELQANGCNDQYTTNIDTNATPDIQILQSLNFIKFNLRPSVTPPVSNLQKIYNSKLYGTVVYLFSTQYAGPVGGYYDKNSSTGIVSSSKSLCIDQNATVPCSCIASQFNSSASCGDENSFGSWGAHLTDFKNFVFGAGGFMSSQGGANCPGASSCSPGLYMYDFIPQAWYK